MKIKKIRLLSILFSVLWLCSCASHQMPTAPCDNFGNNCNPKEPINHRVL